MSKYAEDNRLAGLLRDAETIAVVGASPKPNRPSYQVMTYLQNAGYSVIPVNPGQAGKEILGLPVYGHLSEIEEPVDIVDIFRQSEFVGGVVDEAIDIKAGAVWMQLDIKNDQAAKTAKDAGLQVVMDRCTKIEHARLLDRINNGD